MRNDMRVLMLSLDGKILENNSAVRQRIIALAEKSGDITVFVPAEKDERREVSPHLKVHGFSGGKIVQLWKMWREGKQILSQTQPPKATPCMKGDTTTPKPLLGKEGRKNDDLITVQDIHFLGFLAVRLAEKFSVSLEVQVHGFEKMRGVREWFTRFVLARADRIRVVSNRLKELLTTYYLLPPTRIYILPVYTQIGERGGTGERGKKSEEVPHPFTFLTVGRLVPVKNIGMQIRAFSRLAKEYPQIRLRVVGDGPERNNLRFAADNLQLVDKVVFEGEQKDIRRFYEAADAFLLTSDSEGWGLAVTETAGYGLPIIMTDVGLAGEFIKNEENGLVIPVGDEDALILAMRRVLGDVELRARLGEAAFRAFKSLPSAGEQVRKQVEVWRGLQ